MTTISQDSYVPTGTINWPALHPVGIGLQEHSPKLTGPEKMQDCSSAARKALQHSADLSNVRIGVPEKDRNGVPLPKDGAYWSVSHTRGFAAGVVAPYPVGIDVEQVRDVSATIEEQVATPLEWQMGGGCDTSLFFRYWTAKEAVLKASGHGLSGLAGCMVTKVIDDRHLKLSYNDKDWLVSLCRIPGSTESGQPGHVIAVTTRHQDVTWHISTPPEPK